MNKMIKGSVAGAAGVALLMGGFGTYALWTDEAVLGSQTVSSGVLDIVDVGSPVWADVSAERVDGDWDASEAMVPGDTVTMSRDVVLDVEGKNLGVEFTVSGFDAAAASVDAWSALEVTMTYDGTALDPVAAAPGSFSAVYEAGDHDLNGLKPLVVTFAFGDVTGQVDQNLTLNLAEATVSVAQVRPNGQVPN